MFDFVLFTYLIFDLWFVLLQEKIQVTKDPYVLKANPIQVTNGAFKDWMNLKEKRFKFSFRRRFKSPMIHSKIAKEPYVFKAKTGASIWSDVVHIHEAFGERAHQVSVMFAEFSIGGKT